MAKVKARVAVPNLERRRNRTKVLLRHFQYTLNVFLKQVPPRRHATVYPDDVFLISYPKSGNTWMQFMVGNLVFQNDPITFANVNQRIPSFSDMPEKHLRRVPRPRYIKSHEPFHTCYQNVIYIVRDPRDVVVSYYHFLVKKKRLPRGSPFDACVPGFIADNTVERVGPWADNVVGWIAMGPSRKKFLLLRYEDLLENASRELSKVAALLDIHADEEKLNRAIQLSSVDRMRRLEKEEWKSWEMTKRTRADIPFVRAATSGQWAEALSPESVRAIECAWGPVMQALGYKLTNDPKELAAASETWTRWEAQVRTLFPSPEFTRTL